MKKKELERLRKKLLKKKEEILSKLEEIGKETSEEGESLIEYYDKATYQFSKEYKIALGQKDAEILRQIERALQKMREGTYGICEDCGKPIPPKRLTAVPWAIYCIECAEKHEMEKESEAEEDENYY